MNNARTHSAVQATVPLPGWGNAASDRLSYDGVGRMITKRYLTGGINGTTGAYNNTTALVGYTSSFDRASNKLYERHLEGDESRSHLYQPFNSDGSFAVGYDSANRLRQYQRGVLSTATIPYLVNPGASISTPITLPGTDQARTYGLDGLGNWKSTHFTEVGSGGSTTSTAETRAHNYVNEITAVKDITGSTTTSTPFAYDKNGNLLNDGVRSYQWDALNRLVQVNRMSDGAVIGAYTYDALNRRIQKTISNGGLTDDVTNGSSTYLYDNQQVAMQRDGSGNWLQAYFWGRYIDELLFLTAPTETVPTTYRVLSDLLYRSTALVDTGNNIVEAYDCDAYGNTLCFSGPGADSQWFTNDDIRTNNPINTTTFTGRLYDPESQIYYYRARYYSPHIGRFINRDPLENAEQDQGPNVYWYVANNPVVKLDPEGLLTLSYVTVPGSPAPVDCGGITWQIYWTLDGPASSQGEVIQEINLDVWDVTDCKGNPISYPSANEYPYWEDIGTFIANSNVSTLGFFKRFDDTWGMPPRGACSKGTVTISGTATFYPGLTRAPATFQSNPFSPARAALSTKIDPKLSGGSNPVHRVLTVIWDCCGNDKRTRFAAT